MRDSYFTSDIAAVLRALKESEPRCDAHLNASLLRIETQIETLLHDDRSPEREWRQQTVVPLLSLAGLLRSIGKPVPSAEHLATEMST